MSDKELYSGMIRLHILYHASKGPIFGLWIIEELGRHGYKLSPGTLYPILHALEYKGYLRSTQKREGRQARPRSPGFLRRRQGVHPGERGLRFELAFEREEVEAEPLLAIGLEDAPREQRPGVSALRRSARGRYRAYPLTTQTISAATHFAPRTLGEEVAAL